MILLFQLISHLRQNTLILDSCTYSPHSLRPWSPRHSAASTCPKATENYKHTGEARFGWTEVSANFTADLRGRQDQGSVTQLNKCKRSGLKLTFFSYQSPKHLISANGHNPTRCCSLELSDHGPDPAVLSHQSITCRSNPTETQPTCTSKGCRNHSYN